jgi:hypothetical protein
MNNLEPVDPLIKPTNNNFFHADEKMHYILVNKDIQTYLDYCKNKYLDSKYINQEIIEEKPNIKELLDKYNEYILKERQDRVNKHKKIMLESIWSNITNLENTINKLVPKK